MNLILPPFTLLPEHWPKPPPRVAEGVCAVLFYGADGTLYIPFIASPMPGCGYVGRYLEALPTDRNVVFVTVESVILDGMLARRGYATVKAMSPALSEREAIVPCRVRLAQAAPAGGSKQ